ncbi:MAG: acetoacetate decarboxylase [Albidovulum sp.]|nr:acetoacetate decarboxylase [Albidovulum sp.]
MTIEKFGLSSPAGDEIRDAGFSTPWDAPTVPPFPFRFRNAEILTVFYRTDPSNLAFLTPEPLEPTGEHVAIHIYRMNDTDWLGPYAETNVMFGTALRGKAEGAYSPYLFLSSEVGVAHGREIHGQPKKLANPRLEFLGDLIVGTVERNGIDIVTATLPYKQIQADPIEISAKFDFSRNINLKAVDHIDGRPAIRQLTSRRLEEVKVHECWKGPCTVELRPNAQAPVFRLPVLEPLEGFYWKADFTLTAGEILFDYLTESDAWRVEKS